jgi:hypothetical protein
MSYFFFPLSRLILYCQRESHSLVPLFGFPLPLDGDSSLPAELDFAGDTTALLGDCGDSAAAAAVGDDEASSPDTTTFASCSPASGFFGPSYICSRTGQPLCVPALRAKQLVYPHLFSVLRFIGVLCRRHHVTQVRVLGRAAQMTGPMARWRS